MFLGEVAGYALCRGPFILHIHGWSAEKLPPDHLRLLIIMEYMQKGSLTKLLQQEYNQLTNRRKVLIACDIVSGMHRIHQHGVIHRDIRPDNILIDNCYRAKIGDMGISQSYYPQFGFNNSPMGCIRYMPPEFYWNTYNQTLDVFTFGLTLNHLFTGTDHNFDPNTKTTFHVMKEKHDRQQLATNQELLKKETGFRHLLAYLFSTLFTEEELRVSSVDASVRGTQAFDPVRVGAIDRHLFDLYGARYAKFRTSNQCKEILNKKCSRIRSKFNKNMNNY
ncbi:unnamed protein product [Rotaria sp. Silwood2]|nr:unnamed protein product [Rotaria sp. Silwood2]